MGLAAAILLPSLAFNHGRPMESPAPAPAEIPVQPAAPADEAALLRRFAGGDDGAFAELVGRYQQLAYVVACRITLHDDLGYDVVQEAFLRCLRHRGRFDTSKAFKPWLLQIVRHLAIDALRIQRRIDAGTSASAALERVETSADPSAGTRRAELRSRVASVLASLPEKYSDILIMREMEDLPAEEIARQINVDYGTTRWRLHEARRLFRAAWVARFGDQEQEAAHA